MEARLLLLGLSLGLVLPAEAGQAETTNDLNSHLKQGAPSLRSWVDLSSYLPTGTLTHLEVSVDAFDTKLTPTLRLQVWKPIGDNEETEQYSLKWQKLITLDKGGNRHYEIKLKANERVAVRESDKLGWTADSSDVKVSSEFDESYGSLFYVLRDGHPPVVGANYKFDGLILPKRFSITPTVNQAGSPGVGNSVDLT